MRFIEFFTANIRNPHTRRAYGRAVGEFLAWCAEAGVPSIAAVQPLHVATWIELQTKTVAAPSVKQKLAATRHLFDWLVTGQVVPVNPAASVRGPAHIVRHGKTPVLEAAEARVLLNSIKIVKTFTQPDGTEIDTAETSFIGLRDRALIAVMVFSLARIGAALGMKVEDVYTQNRRLWVRLREKGDKAHAMPCHHSLEEYLHAYIDGAGLAGEPKGPLFRTIGRGTSCSELQSSASRIAIIGRSCPESLQRAEGADPQSLQLGALLAPVQIRSFFADECRECVCRCSR